MKYNDFRDLEVWKSCAAIRVKIWEFCKKFPRDEKNRLIDQMLRASRSATANIAEGYGRYHYQESIQFCRQARGSLYELIDHLLTAQECHYLNSDQTDAIIEEIKISIALLNGYVKYLKRRKEED